MECDGDKEVNGNGNEGGRQATATGMKRAMMTATRVAGNKKAMAMAADGDESGRQVKATKVMATTTVMATVMVTATVMATAMATATALVTMWTMMMATRLVGNEKGKGKGGKSNDDGDEGGRQGRGQGQQGNKGGR